MSRCPVRHTRARIAGRGRAYARVGSAAGAALPAVVWADGAVRAPGLTHAPAVLGSLAQLTLGLAVVLLVLLAGAWLLRRFTRLPPGAGGALRILGGLSMGPRERVVLVQVGKTRLLLGVAPGRVQTLHVLDDAEPDSAPPAPERSGFAQRLAAALKGRGAA